jgi:hypothetical protein
MKFRKLRQEFLRIIGLFVLSLAVDLLCKSLKVTFKNKEVIDNLENQNRNYVLAFWHGQMLLAWFLSRNKNFTALISKSKDGELLSRILKNWNYNVVRGSSSKGGEIALGIMVDSARNKESVAVTPDGPKGPIYKMKAGAVITAKKSNSPIVLLAVGYKKKRVLNSWDKFEIPRFFSEAKAVFSNPIYVDSDLSYESTSALILKCEKELNKLRIEANEFGTIL